VPLAPEHSILAFSAPILAECLLLGVGVGLVASLYPAWQASRMAPARAMRWEG
jgi:ABC-type antimicrobial peptide transport system permease subunit